MRMVAAFKADLRRCVLRMVQVIDDLGESYRDIFRVFKPQTTHFILNYSKNYLEYIC